MKYIGLICLAIGLMSCRSENNAAFYAGGTMTVNLPQGEKLEQVSWKADQRVGHVSLWYLTTKRDATESPKTHIFREKSEYDEVQGTVVLQEQ